MSYFGSRSPYPRAVINCDPSNYILAARALKWLLARPDQKDAILAYGEGKQEVVFYVKRNKASLSIMQSFEPVAFKERQRSE
jgi:hypothetical protein